MVSKDQEEPLVLTNEVPEKQSSTSENILSPAVRKIVKENKINLETVHGSGKDGRTASWVVLRRLTGL